MYFVFSRPVDMLYKMNSVVFISLLGTVTFCQCSSAYWWVRKNWKGRELWVFSFCVIIVSEFVYVWGGLSVFWWSVVPLYCGGFSQWVGLEDWLVKVPWSREACVGVLVGGAGFLLSLFEDSGLLFWVLISSASDQKLFCGVCSAFTWSFDEFVGEKVVSPSYFSASLAPLSEFVW